jgi:hypothetical protein
MIILVFFWLLILLSLCLFTATMAAPADVRRRAFSTVSLADRAFIFVTLVIAVLGIFGEAIFRIGWPQLARDAISPVTIVACYILLSYGLRGVYFRIVRPRCERSEEKREEETGKGSGVEE